MIPGCEEIARAALGEPARRQGAELLWRCPRHDDKHPSLQVNTNKNVWICGPCGQSGNAWQLAAFLAGTSPDDKAAVTAWLCERGLLEADGRGGGRRIVATYDYRDESGKLLFQTVRYQPKDFRQRRPDGKGGWIWNLEGVTLVPYRLPEWKDKPVVYIVEGEKDADALWRLGLPATCNPMAAGKWRDQYNPWFKGKCVVNFPDNDPLGEAHMLDVARRLLPVAAAVKIVRLPGLPPKGDVSDWIAAGGTREKLGELVKAATVVTAADLAEQEPGGSGTDANSSARASGFRLTKLGDLLQEPEERTPWLLEGILPAAGVSLLAAKPKTGKSTWARGLALAVARGEPFLGRVTTAGSVLYLALEEKRNEVKNHFAALGARGDEPLHAHIDRAPAGAVAAAALIIAEHKPVLVIVDPLLKFTRVRDANDYAEITAKLEPLMVLARESGAHLLLVYHAGKSVRSDPVDAALGSTAFAAAVDTVLVMKRTERYRTIQTIQRYGDDLPETVLDFDPQRKAVSLGAEKSEAEEKRVADAIVDHLGACGGEPTEPEICQMVEGKVGVKRVALRELVSKGRINRTGGGKKGDPYHYRLAAGFSFSCSPRIEGTRKQESKNAGYPTETEAQMLVPVVPAENAENRECGEQEIGVVRTAELEL